MCQFSSQLQLQLDHKDFYNEYNDWPLKEDLVGKPLILQADSRAT